MIGRSPREQYSLNWPPMTPQGCLGGSLSVKNTFVHVPEAQEGFSPSPRWRRRREQSEPPAKPRDAFYSEWQDPECFGDPYPESMDMKARCISFRDQALAEAFRKASLSGDDEGYSSENGFEVAARSGSSGESQNTPPAEPEQLLDSNFAVNPTELLADERYQSSGAFGEVSLADTGSTQEPPIASFANQGLAPDTGGAQDGGSGALMAEQRGMAREMQTLPTDAQPGATVPQWPPSPPRSRMPNSAHQSCATADNRRRPAGTGAVDPMPWGADVVTVMVRQISRQYSQWMFLQEVTNHGFNGLFDFLYLPYDLKKGVNVGYGFINFTEPRHALAFRDAYDGVYLDRQMRLKCKPLRVHPASVQGYKANFEHFAHTKTGQKQDPAFSPLFFPSGNAAAAMEALRVRLSNYHGPTPWGRRPALEAGGPPGKHLPSGSLGLGPSPGAAEVCHGSPPALGALLLAASTQRPGLGCGAMDQPIDSISQQASPLVGATPYSAGLRSPSSSPPPPLRTGPGPTSPSLWPAGGVTWSPQTPPGNLAVPGAYGGYAVPSPVPAAPPAAPQLPPAPARAPRLRGGNWSHQQQPPPAHEMQQQHQQNYCGSLPMEPPEQAASMWGAPMPAQPPLTCSACGSLGYLGHRFCLQCGESFTQQVHQRIGTELLMPSAPVFDAAAACDGRKQVPKGGNSAWLQMQNNTVSDATANDGKRQRQRQHNRRVPKPGGGPSPSLPGDDAAVQSGHARMYPQERFF